MFLGITKCIECETKFEKRHPKQIRCPDCQKERLREERKKYHIQTYCPKITKKDPNECKKKRSCIYGGRAGSVDICDYMSIEGHSRGCPVQGCDKYKRKQKRGRKAEAIIIDEPIGGIE